MLQSQHLLWIFEIFPTVQWIFGAASTASGIATLPIAYTRFFVPLIAANGGSHSALVSVTPDSLSSVRYRSQSAIDSQLNITANIFTIGV